MITQFLNHTSNMNCSDGYGPRFIRLVILHFKVYELYGLCYIADRDFTGKQINTHTVLLNFVPTQKVPRALGHTSSATKSTLSIQLFLNDLLVPIKGTIVLSIIFYFEVKIFSKC